MTITKPATYSYKVLENIAREIGEVYKGYQIQSIFLDLKIPEFVIPENASKWFMVNEAFKHIKNKYQKSDDEISKLIMEFLNPLNHKLDEEKAKEFQEVIKKAIELGNAKNTTIGKDFLIFSDDENKKSFEEIFSEKQDTFNKIFEEINKHNEDIKGKDEEPEIENPEIILENLVKVAEQKNVGEIISNFNKEDVSKLNKDEKIYMLKVLYSYYEAIISSYYGSGIFFVTNGIDILNDCFKLLRKKIIDIVNSDDTFSELKNSEVFNNYMIEIRSIYVLPELLEMVWEEAVVPSLIDIREQIADKDLFENNKEIHPSNRKVVDFLNLTNNEIRILQTNMAVKTKNFYQKSSSQVKDTISPEKKETKEDVIKHEHNHKHYHEGIIPDKPIQMEIVNEIAIKNVEDNSIKKGNSKIYPPKFPATDWSNITIRFISEEDVFISIGKDGKQNDGKQTNYEALGFKNSTTGKPDTQWKFLLLLSVKNGFVSPPLELTEKQKANFRKKKSKLVENLRKIFGNNTDPFDDFNHKKGYQILINLIPPIDYKKAEENIYDDE